MNWQKVIPAVVAVCAVLAGCNRSRNQEQTSSDSAPNVVTKDIQNGIEKHIEEQMRLGQGYFSIPFDEQELKLKLVKVHTEYLANLGPRRHFACVDLASTDGDVYAGIMNETILLTQILHPYPNVRFFAKHPR
jgi:hypothetical protein